MQRKALEVSIAKNKKVQEELDGIKATQHEHAEGKKLHNRQVEHLE